MVGRSDSEYSPLSTAIHRSGNILHDLDLSSDDDASDAVESEFELTKIDFYTKSIQTVFLDRSSIKKARKKNDQKNR